MGKKIIEEKDVEYVARLAKLELNENQKELFLKQLNDILDYFKQLNQLDTEEVEPTSYILNPANLFHDDEPKPSLPQDMVLGMTKYKKNGYIKVPKILNN